ncbi:efflux transporter outer membrane subunit [Prevotella sp. E15-22]|jgi:NodT family efflux transporter outer membrane factor (OMF) lipoprotein|uniref:TolC family protein n=1 Tax=Prevotella sp. E15-22 TaxID=2937774 RepID=UPI002065656A|nr:efflux transporter outer membrane subunit [Prevotella sp. E15-22]UPS45855.1 efflux transporter outer membrane subunit [Prevotella sp. E15-22]
MLTSCGLYNKYERPDVNTQGLVRDIQNDGDTLALNSDENFGNLPWREVFTDPQLQGLIEQALENNVDLRNAALNVKMMETALTVSKLAFLPSVAFAPQGTISQVQMDGASVSRTYQLPISATWNLDLFGNLLSQKRSAQMKLLATKDYQVAVQTKIICGVANLYYTLMMLDEQLAIVTDMEGLTKDTWDMMKLQMELGRARSTSVQTAEANYYSVQAKKADLKQQIREMENSMSLLLNEPGHQIARGKFYNQSLPTTFSAGVGIQLLSNRADVHSAEMALAQCFYDTETARSRFYPNLSITGTAMFTNNLGTIVNPGKWILSAVGALTQPIFQHGQIVAGLKVAKAQQEQALNTFQNTILKAGNEVSNALLAYNTCDEKSKLDEKQVKIYEQNVEDTKLLYTSKGSTYLEVIQAQNGLLNARISKVTDDFNKMQAVVNLYQALGGGSK